MAISKGKRPLDSNQLAEWVVETATGTRGIAPPLKLTSKPVNLPQSTSFPVEKTSTDMKDVPDAQNRAQPITRRGVPPGSQDIEVLNTLNSARQYSLILPLTV